MPRKAGDVETSMFTRGRIIGMYEGGVPKMMISKKLHIDPKTIRKWILRYETHGENGLKSIPKPGAHRKTTVYEDVAIAQAVAVTPTISAQEINKMLGLNISSHTIRRRVRDAKIRSRQEKREGRLAKKKIKGEQQQQCETEQVNSSPEECSLSGKRKAGVAGKKTRKKKQSSGSYNSQQVNPMMQQQTQPQPQSQPQPGPQIQNSNLAKPNNVPPNVAPIIENGMHQQFVGKVETMQPASIPSENHNNQLPQQQTHQYQSKQMPFYGFAHSSAYEFPRIWTPMTNVREFSPGEVTQIAVQTATYINPTVSSPN